MKLFKTLAIAASLLGTATLATPAIAQASSYKPGTVWEVGRINVLPGQFENYMDWLAGQWKKVNELARAEGLVVDYHVLVSTHPRSGEPDVILIIEYKDFLTTAQQEAFNKKVNALLSQDDRKAGAASAERGKMREQLGSVQYQEMVLN
ncbi:MAG: hypothetical protein EBR34_08310 [Sphingomonadaceae bacterium]|nr:hypothetical protein [Sphingomonadaceae bacterium]